MDSVLLRCQNCQTINRVSVKSLDSTLKCGNCKNALSYSRGPIDVNFDTFQKEVVIWPGFVLLEFWTPTCVYCMRLSPVLDQIASEKAGMLKVAKVNAQTEIQLAEQFGIQGVPNLVLFQNGKKIAELPGAVPKEQLEQWISSSTGI
jgi:thioredoxin